MEAILLKIKKNKTNNGNLAKQYIYVLKDGKLSDALVIHKYILSDSLKLYGLDFIILKRFRGKYLFFQLISIKCSTFLEISELINIHYKNLQNGNDRTN